MSDLFWTVPRLWEGETAFIVAGGPSVKEQDTDKLSDRHVVAVNSSFQTVPFAEYVFFGDRRWWHANQEPLKSFEGEQVTVAARLGQVLNSKKPVRYLRKMGAHLGVCQSPDGVVMQRTSLSGAINLAVHLGASRIVLLGADMRAEGSVTHHHKPHPWPSKPGCWDRQMADLRYAEAPLKKLGVEVVNTSLRSKIDWWPKKPLEECL